MEALLKIAANLGKFLDVVPSAVAALPELIKLVDDVSDAFAGDMTQQTLQSKLQGAIEANRRGFGELDEALADAPAPAAAPVVKKIKGA